MKPLNKLSPISAALLLSLSSSGFADQVIQDDSIVVGSICIGLDCVNGENFAYDTIRLKENNLRIRAIDTSSTGSFPTRDWQITFNDSANGGENKFSIEDIDAGKIPFTILADAPSNSLYVNNYGNIGLGTSIPLLNIHVKEGNTPALRLEQDNSLGWGAHTWDVAGHEGYFFIRDYTNGTLPFMISAGAPHNSLHIARDGDIGLNTRTPDGQFDVAHSSDPNDHAFLISPESYVGVNIDNGEVPKGLFDVQTWGGNSRFTVLSDGDVGIGTANPTGRFEVRDLDDSTSYFNVGDTGNVGIGTNAPSATLHVATSADSLVDVAIFENTNPSSLHAKNITLKNAGSNLLTFINTAPDTGIPAEWNLQSRHEEGSVYITNPTYNGNEFQLTKEGNLIISGDITANGHNYASSKTLKENFTTLDLANLLNKVSKLTISQWNYIRDDNSIKHIGPFAEEFHDTFKLNGNKTETISISDISGISLAAIQALIMKMNKQSEKIEELESKINNIN